VVKGSPEWTRRIRILCYHLYDIEVIRRATCDGQRKCNVFSNYKIPSPWISLVLLHALAPILSLDIQKTEGYKQTAPHLFTPLNHQNDDLFTYLHVQTSHRKTSLACTLTHHFPSFSAHIKQYHSSSKTPASARTPSPPNNAN